MSEKEETFLPPLPRGKGGVVLPQSQSETIVVTRTNLQTIPTRSQERARRASTGMYPTLPISAPRSESKRVTRIIENLHQKGDEMSPVQRKTQLSRGLNDVVVLKETDSLRLLLDQGASPNGSTKSPCTPLYVAVDMQLPQACKILLQAGASMVRKTRKQRQSALQLAVKERPGMRPILFDRVRELELAYTGTKRSYLEEEDESDDDELPPQKKVRSSQ